MRTKSIFICLLVAVLAVPMLTNAQSLRDYIQSRAGGTDSLLMKAVMPSLSIVRQQYRLERGGEYYGKNNMPFYGESYSLGVKIPGFTILQNQVLTPWMNDMDYQRANKTGKYTPVRFWSLQRSLNDSVYTPVEWELDSHYTRPIDNDSLLFKNEDTISDFGLNIDDIPGGKSGYMIWVYSSTNLQDSAMHILLKQTSFRLSGTSENSELVMEPSDPEKVLGGVFIVPYFERGGVIRLTLAGVASKSLNGEWTLLNFAKQETNTTPQKEEEDLKKKSNKKKQKENSSDDEPTPVG